MDELRLAEPAAIWPSRWRRVFALLPELGVPVQTVDVTSAVSGDIDLGRVQALLRGEAAHGSTALKGDGSLLLLRAETPAELAEALVERSDRWRR